MTLKYIYFIGVSYLCTIGSYAQSKTNTEDTSVKYANSISADELSNMLHIYASDEFEGRETGKKGQKLAINFLKDKYVALNIPSPLKNNSYFQEVPLENKKVGSSTITVNGKEFNNLENHFVNILPESLNLNLNEIVYVGYGIDTDTYSDYKNIDVTNKYVLAIAGEPKDKLGNFITSGKPEDTKWSGGRQAISSKRDAAINNGASGFLYLDDAIFNRYLPYYKSRANSSTQGRLALKNINNKMAMFMINSELGKAIYSDIENSTKPKVVSTKVTINAKNNSEKVISENVLAFLKGTEKPNEIIVISSHLDHVGIIDGQIHNGADDDGSGTVALLEIAEAFKKASLDGFGPKRSILFLHVTGEEKGLLGSQYYSDFEPIFPLNQVVANLNIDMIGRTDPKRIGDRNYIYLIGSDKLSTELHTISNKVNLKYCNLELDYKYNDENDPNRFYYRSDHYNFAKNNIPVIFYFNGTHEDYHKPTDTPDKIEYDLLEKRAKLIFHTAWDLANRDNRIVVDKASK